MKTAYLIYCPEEAEKNHLFIRMFQEAGEKYGIKFSYVPVQEYRNLPLPDLVLNRTRQTIVSRWYEGRKIPVYHSADLVRLGNDKYLCLDYLQNTLPSEISETDWAPESICLYSEEREKLLKEQKFSQRVRQFAGGRQKLVIKTADGHGGSEVYLLPSDVAQDCAIWSELLGKLKGKKLLLQEKIECDSRDLRVYILGGKIYEAILRQGKEDFRSNYSLGGQVSQYTLSPEQKVFVQYFIQAFGGEQLGMAGIDFLLDRSDHLIFNELEEMVGTRMLYQCTGKDIVTDYVRWLAGISDICSPEKA